MPIYSSTAVATVPKSAASIGKLIVIEKQVANLIRASEIRHERRVNSRFHFRIAAAIFQREFVLLDCVPKVVSVAGSKYQ